MISQSQRVRLSLIGSRAQPFWPPPARPLGHFTTLNCTTPPLNHSTNATTNARTKARQDRVCDSRPSSLALRLSFWLSIRPDAASFSRPIVPPLCSLPFPSLCSAVRPRSLAVLVLVPVPTSAAPRSGPRRYGGVLTALVQTRPLRLSIHDCQTTNTPRSQALRVPACLQTDSAPSLLSLQPPGDWLRPREPKLDKKSTVQALGSSQDTRGALPWSLCPRAKPLFSCGVATRLDNQRYPPGRYRSPRCTSLSLACLSFIFVDFPLFRSSLAIPSHTAVLSLCCSSRGVFSSLLVFFFLPALPVSFPAFFLPSFVAFFLITFLTALQTIFPNFLPVPFCALQRPFQYSLPLSRHSLCQQRIASCYLFFAQPKQLATLTTLCPGCRHPSRHSFSRVGGRYSDQQAQCRRIAQPLHSTQYLQVIQRLRLWPCLQALVAAATSTCRFCLLLGGKPPVSRSYSRFRTWSLELGRFVRRLRSALLFCTLEV